MEQDDAAEGGDDGMDEERIRGFAADENRRQDGKKHGYAETEADTEQIGAERREERYRQEDSQMDGSAEGVLQEGMLHNDQHENVEEYEYDAESSAA